jgi:hypothetical protein
MIDTHPHHNPGCPGGALKERIETDNVRVRCRGCGAYWLVPHGKTTMDPDVDAPTITPRLVCRDHHDQPVAASGNGCQTCAQARRDRETAKAGRRAKQERV